MPHTGTGTYKSKSGHKRNKKKGSFSPRAVEMALRMRGGK